MHLRKISVTGFSFILFFPIFLSHANSIQKIGYEHGLSNDHIASITQDKNGFLWFATEWGLNRFNGHTIKVYMTDPENRNSICGNGLNKVLADKNKNVIWIATKDFGLSRFDCHTEQFYNYPTNKNERNGTGTGGITDLCFDKDSNLWIATYNNGIKWLDVRKDSIIHLNRKNSMLSGMHVWSITDDRKGKLYVGRVNEGFSIISLPDLSVKTYTCDPDDSKSIPNNNVYKVFIDSKKNVWLGSMCGLALFHPESGKFTVFRHNQSDANSLSDNEIVTIEEINGNLWIGTVNGGVNLFDLGQDLNAGVEHLKFKHIYANNPLSGLSSNYINNIFQDSFGNIWIGTFGRGVNFISHIAPFFHQMTYTGYKEDNNALSSQTATAICADSKKRLWIGLDGGGVDLFKNGNKIYNYNKENETAPDNTILCGRSDSKGTVWLGTYSHGLIVYNEKKNIFEKYKLSHDKHTQIWCIFEDSDKNLWIGSNEGIVVVDLKSNHIRELNGKDIGLPNNLIRSIVEDGNRNIWVASLIDGVSIINSQCELIHKLPVIRVNHMYKDSKERIWLASQYGMMLFKSPGNFEYETLNRSDGLPDDWVKAIIEGKEDEMWMSTNNGISRFHIDKKIFDNYNYDNKLPLASFRSGTVEKTSDGIIYFGSQDGVCYFDFKAEYADFKVPATVITGFNIYDSKKILPNNSSFIPAAQKIRLEHNQNTFSIDFNVMDYALKNQIEYAYSLNGADNLWYETSDRNQVTFRNLSPGKYIFNVKSRLRNQEWTNDITAMQIDIKPPFWLSWWAEIIYFLLGFTILGMIAKYYFEKKDRRKEQELNNEKLRFYTNVAHELKTPLTLIIGPLADLMNDKSTKPEHTQKISLIYKSASRLLDLINQILEFRKSETHNRKLCIQNGDISKLIQEVILKYKELNQNENLSIGSFSEAKQTKICFDREIMTIILDNLISNAVKYTPQGSIGVYLREISLKGKAFTEIEVRDTGIGIPENAMDKIFNRYFQVKREHQFSGSGIGLALVKNMAQLHKAEIEIKSKEKAGTSFYIRLETKNTYPEAEHITDEESLVAEKKNSDSFPLLLIVEDHEDMRKYIAESFSGLFEIIEANNGKTGVESAIEHIPDIIISDIMMPVMDGINLCRILKDDMRTSHIPIILLTAKDSVYDKIEGYSTGADSYITKPFNATLLQSRVNNLLEARKKIVNFFSTNTYKNIIATNALNELDKQFIEKTTSIIEENIHSEQIRSTFLAEQLCMSYSSFSRKIKMLTGMTSNELIRKIKMQHAEQMILSRKYSITEIAYQLGFNNMSHFRQYFKDEFGSVPSKYLKELSTSKPEN